MISHSFELRVKPQDDDIRCELFEMPPLDSKPENGKEPELMSIASGWQLEMTQGIVARALKNNKYSLVDLKRTRRAPFRLSEEDGIRLDLVFKATRGLVKRSRIEDIMLGIQCMSREEVYYWHAKVTRGTPRENSNGLKALRTLLGGG
jgi:hypothetical protein